MGILRFTVPGQPVPKGRARAAMRGGRMVHYTPDKTVAYERRVQAACEEAMAVAGLAGSGGPIEGAVSVQVVVTFEVPASWSKAKRLKALSGELMHTSKPDIDNVLKAVFDGCNGVLWKDDSQVCDLRASKGYGEVPKVEVVVEWL